MSGTSHLLQPKVWIGIDQSYSGFGLVVLDDAGWTANLWKFKGQEGQRLDEIYKTLYQSFSGKKSYGFEIHVAMEGYAHGSKFNREKLGELGGIVKLACYKALYKDPLIVPPTVLKKYVTGKGTANKALMVTSVNEKWNTTFANDNLADAYALAQYCRENT